MELSSLTAVSPVDGRYIVFMFLYIFAVNLLSIQLAFL